VGDLLLSQIDPTGVIPSGGGNQVPVEEICELNGDFYDVKAAHFANRDGQLARRQVFRYGLSARGCGGIGGQGEVGGNDYIDFNHDGGSLLHELGHTLGLRHGGSGSDNCKPNYVSVMNYDHALGIWRRSGATRMLDYSPPRFVGGRGLAPLPTLEEDDLDETVPLDANDPINRFVYTLANRAKIQWPLDGDADGDGAFDRIPWDGDGALETSVRVNIDNSNEKGRPEDCSNLTSTEELTGHDDWSRISLPFRHFGNASDGPVNPVDSPEPRLEEYEALERELQTADLGIVKAASEDPVEVGDPLVYTLRYQNRGPNPPGNARLEDTLDARVSLIEAPAVCSASGGSVSCDVGALAPGDGQSLQITVDTSDACIDGVPQTLSNRASIADAAPQGRGDPDGSNDVTQLTTQTVDTTPPVIRCHAPEELSPNEAPITFTATAEDVCDDGVTATILDFDCFMFAPNGKRIGKRSSCVVSIDGSSITVHDSGGVGDRIVWRVASEDAAGNQVEAECGLDVVLPVELPRRP
jgi:uncharacterized repeat protein (TIGR01451 family)